jgi:mono/diheme cytochrome c family protein
MPMTAIKLLMLAAAVLSYGALAAEPKNTGGKSRPETLYHSYCSVCHGDRGNGQSRARNSLVPPPRDFTVANLQLPRDTMIAITRDGKPGTAMVGWKTQLSDPDIAGVVDYIRSAFMQADTSHGRALYQKNCSVCHGDRGQGAVWAAGNMSRPPRDFSTAAARKELTRAGMIAVATHGKAGTAMAGFATQLKAGEIETVVDYIRSAFMQVDTANISGTSAHGGREKDAAPAAAMAIKVDMSLPYPDSLSGNRARGEKFYLANCATCHGAKGDGQGPRAYFIRPKPRNFIEAASRQMFNRPALFAGTAKGKLGSEMPAWDKVLSAQEIADVAEYVYTAYIQPTPTIATGKGAK